MPDGTTLVERLNKPLDESVDWCSSAWGRRPHDFAFKSGDPTGNSDQLLRGLTHSKACSCSDTRSRAYELYATGMTMKEVGATMGLSTSRVWQHVTRVIRCKSSSWVAANLTDANAAFYLTEVLSVPILTTQEGL